MMINNRGLIEDVSSLVIAIIGLTLLFGGIGYIVYNVYVNGEEVIAKKAMDVIEKKIELLKEGQSARFPIKGPCEDKNDGDCKWYLVGWSKDDIEGPNRCYFKSCICACKGYDKESCQDGGICRNIEQDKVSILNKIKIGPSGYIKPGVLVPQREVNAIQFSSNLIELQIKKNKDSIEIDSTK